MQVVLFVLLFAAAFAGMEGVAGVAHRYVMHGPLWVLHRSHHSPRTGWFEANDLFGVFFSLPAVAAVYAGTHGAPWALPLGAGMTAYGFAYFAFHDVLVHRRVRHRVGPLRGYLRRITLAHLVHHRTTERDGAVSFGFLWAPKRSHTPFASSSSASRRVNRRVGGSSSDFFG